MTTVTLLAVAMMPMISTPDHLQHGFPAEGASQIHQVRMVGKDTRTAVPEKFRKIASGIGNVINSKGNNCTAFCVAPNAIVTNAHCLAYKYNKKTKKYRTRDISDFLFVLDGESTDIEQQAIEPLGNPYLSTVTIHHARLFKVTAYNDWLIARLSQPLCTGKALKIASQKVTERVWKRGGMHVAMIGWPNTERGEQMFETCWMANPKKRSNGVGIPHLCDSSGGQSGSPLLTKTKDGWRVVAIHRGGWTGYISRNCGCAGPTKLTVVQDFIGINKIAFLLFVNPDGYLLRRLRSAIC